MKSFWFEWMFSCAQLTLQICASHKLEELVDEDDRDGELHHHQPLLHVQVSELEDQLWTRAAPGSYSQKQTLHSSEFKSVFMKLSDTLVADLKVFAHMLFKQ